MSAQCGGAGSRPSAAVILVALLVPVFAALEHREEPTTEPPTYNKETKVAKLPKVSDKVPVVGGYMSDLDDVSLTAELLLATVYIGIIGSVPWILKKLEPEENKGWVAMIQVVSLVIWLVGGLILLTHVILFQSAHWHGFRTLTVVETVYLFSQIITTVGYGDITPAYPRGQVVIGFYVLVSLLLIANMVSEVSSVVVKSIRRGVRKSAKFTATAFKKVGKAAKRLKTAVVGGTSAQSDDLMEAPERGGAEDAAVDYLKFRDGIPLTDRSHYEEADLEKRRKEEWKLIEKPKVDWSTFFATAGAFLVFMLAGVIFYHFYPGEEKTWLQAIYMSVITLSTVGFGAFNATTEGGKVFGAFWMLFGVAALGAFVAAFVKLCAEVKELEKWDPAQIRDQLSENLNKVTNADRVSRYDFIKFALIQCHDVDSGTLASIEREWNRLVPKGGDKIDTSSFRQIISNEIQSPTVQSPKNRQ